MQVQVEKEGSCFCRLTVQLDIPRVNAAYDQARRKVAKSARLPGFRPGKVPAALLERQYGAQIEQEAIEAAVQASLYEALQQEKLQPVTTPTLESIKLRRNEPCQYKVSVEVRPEVVVADWKKLPAPRAEASVKPEEVDAELNKLRDEAAQTVPVEGRTQVADGDHVLLDYAGSLDGTPFEGGTAKGVMVEVGGKDYIPGFAEGLLGKEVPGAYDVPVSFPEDYAAEHLRGKTVQFHMQLHELKQQKRPELDDDFAKDLGKDSLEQVRQELHDRLAERSRGRAEQTQRRALLEALIARNTFDVPPSMVDRQVERTIQTMARRMEMYTQRPHQFSDDELADLRSNNRQEAEFQVRAGLLVAALGEAEKLDVDDAAVRAAIDEVAAGSGGQAAQVHAYYKNEDHFEELRFERLEKRVMAALVEHAELSDPTPAQIAEQAGQPAS